MQIRTIIGTILFFFLMARGIYYVNQTNQPRRKEYTDGWNLLMGQINQIQQYVLGEIKVNTQEFSLTAVTMQQAFVRNMGVVYVASAGAALSKSSLIRLTALFGLLTLSFIYGRAKTTGLTNEDLLEKFQHLLLGVMIGLFIITEPRTYDESKMEKILKGSLENYKQVMESKSRHSQKGEEHAHTAKESESKKTQESSRQGKAEKNSKVHKNKEEVEREERAREKQQQDEEDQKLREEEEEEEERMKEEEDERIRQEEEERIRQEEEEEEEQKRKFKVDEDGFSVMPKKSAKKAQVQRSNAAKQKKEQYDI